MNFYPFHIGDYISHTRHLSHLEDLAYRRMIDWCFLHESGLPSDKEKIAKVIGIDSMGVIDSIIDEFFLLDDGVYINKRVQKEIDKYSDICKKRKKSSDLRWSNANGMQMDTTCNAKGMQTNTITITKTKDKTASKLADSESIKSFENFWLLYPKKVAKVSTQKVWAKLTQEEREQAVTAIPHHAKGWTDLQYTPHPTTWLNQKRFVDEIVQEGTGVKVVVTPEAQSKIEERQRLQDDFGAKQALEKLKQLTEARKLT